MTREDIIRMAREAQSVHATETWTFALSANQLERFFHAAYAAGAAAEREACAKVCDDKAKETFSSQCQTWGDYFACVIRARGNT